MKTLYLSLKKEPFDVMVTGEKTVKYRKPSQWIISRLEGKEYDVVKFTNGYGSDKPYFIAEFRGFLCSHGLNKFRYSNGFTALIEPGDIMIVLGKIIERGNS